MNRIELTVSIQEVIIQYTYNIYSRELLHSFLLALATACS